MERCKDSLTGLTAGSNQSEVCQCLELDRRHGLCPCVRFWGRVRFLSLACTCIAHAVCVLFARVCQAITPGVPHTIPLRVPVGPPLPSVRGCINITCNTNDVHQPRRPHTCIRHVHGRLITHTLAIYIMPSVISGGYHCMCGNTLTIPHAPSLFSFIPTPTVYLAAQIGCSRCAHHLITLKYKQMIVFLQLTLGLRVRVVPGFQLCVRHQACAPGLQTGACGTKLVDGSVSQTCA